MKVGCYICNNGELNTTPGFVYLLHDHLNHSMHYKIGLSKNVKQRIKKFKYARLIHSFPTENMEEAEAKLHQIFANQRLEGEWFYLFGPNIEYIKSIVEYKDGQFILSEDHQ